MVFITLLGIVINTWGQEQTQQLVDEGLERLKQNQESQQTIDTTLEKIQAMEKEFQDELQLLDSLNMYNAMLKRQLDDQNAQISKTNTSINNVTLIERQIMPLLVRMVDALDSYVAVDLPFLQSERVARVNGLKDLLNKADYTTSEKTRRVFEAYQIENEYGYTIESYKGRVSLSGEQFAVDFLRVGRIGLMYRDLAGDRVGFWNNASKLWQPLTERQYKRHITKGLKIAREEISPELITLPILANIEVR
ncbi:MAG: hypothetical protein ACJAVV_000833 [Alphaproteobacteria bacterium]